MQMLECLVDTERVELVDAESLGVSHVDCHPICLRSVLNEFELADVFDEDSIVKRVFDCEEDRVVKPKVEYPSKRQDSIRIVVCPELDVELISTVKYVSGKRQEVKPLDNPRGLVKS
jgi:hypothetical protein